MESVNNLLRITEYKSRQKIPVDNVQEVQPEVISEDTTPATVITQVPAEQVVHSFKSALASDIKAAIYNRSHPEVSGVTTSYGTSFNAICQTLNISPGKSITKSDLNKLTRNDALEDANKDFCGALNRAFSYLSPNDTISYNDLMLFFMRGAGNDGNMNFAEYQSVVETYSDIVQQQYEACTTAQQKLEFAIEKTRDYLIESRMDLQLAALERLTTEPVASQNNPAPDPSYIGSVQQEASIGQIAFADLGGYTVQDGYQTITKGAYTTTMASTAQTVHESDVFMWGGDEDISYTDSDGTHWADGGITLNSTYYLKNNSKKWYELVETFVHELTHATAHYYYNVTNEGISFSDRGIEFMKNQGFINSANEYYDSYEHFYELWYLVNSMWDEWAAYTTTCNYWDSIGGDVFNGSSQNLAVKGTDEQNAIEQHLVDTGYNGDKTLDDGTTAYRQVPNPMQYYNWDYQTFEKMFYFA